VSTLRSTRGPRELTRADRSLEVLAVILLGVATVGSAWCGYQASKWNSDQGDLARHSSDLRVEASRQFTLATQAVSYDAAMVAQYAQAFQQQNANLMLFYRTSLIRPAFLPVLDAWEAQVKAGKAPTNLLSDQAYLDQQFASYRSSTAEADAASLAGDQAGRNGDAFVLTTLLFAVALFFAGVTSSFRYRSVRIILLIGAVAAIAFAAARLVTVPVA
jgi:hypothetical protein